MSLFANVGKTSITHDIRRNGEYTTQRMNRRGRIREKGA